MLGGDERNPKINGKVMENGWEKNERDENNDGDLRESGKENGEII